MRGPAVAFLVAGCLSKPPPPFATCGDGELQPQEHCDDGNTAGGDGCSQTCEIEPWFTCPVTGELCHPITELQWLGDGVPLVGIGGGGGGEYEEDCRDVVGLDGRRTVVVGVSGGADVDGASLTELRVICADVELRPDGSIRWQNPMATPSHGNNAVGAVAMQMCDTDEVATGFVGSAANVVSGIQLACQAVTHAQGKLAFGAANRLAAIGPNNQPAQPPQSCGENAIARGMVGKSGSVIDVFSLRCVATTPVICGDELIMEPETCDDGNAIPGDGCNARCDGD